MFWKKLKLSETIGKYLGPSLIAQGGVAIGLASALAESDPELAMKIHSIILTTVIFFEVLGPSAIRWSLIKSKEARI
ncbi:MAG: hypothetical protein IH914_06130 [candidate division Zixibacteria bacterium]|nr:hypothetical protein [candidate division Zixibacteria bacterium]